ncbi:HNH endonuclease signature motif containing protein [Diaminobutyricimonas sp. TR449]|uniref:HNH endonuclease signature motif containing protein n=1 Tax=Diaminobutyricimonas sp. TR449 TaxID=2708076 RepID=UPI0014226F0D|nr:HNH endonuclease signature motif containing protein [Diaminobutyricimonas sp. TR449]
MSEFSSQLAAAIASAHAAVELVPAQSARFGELDDDSLVLTNRALAEIRRAVDARSAVVAGEIAARSTRENGYGGLAQREGFRSPEKFIQHITGTTLRDAGKQVRAGTLIREVGRDAEPGDGLAPDAAPPAPARPWLVFATAAVAAGWLGVDVLDSIARGIGEPSEVVIAEALADVTTTLLGMLRSAHDAGGPVDADRAFLLARSLRDELDDQLVAEREAKLHEARAFRRVRGPNGLPRYIVDPDIETAALIDDICNRITSPRRGGPRFVSEEDKSWAQAVVDDPRTTDQYLHDAVVDLLRFAATADTSETRHIVGSRMPAVRVLVAAPNLEQHEGTGHIEGAEFPVSVATVERIVCTAGTIDINFAADGQPLTLGREQRLFTRAQRIALAARDGGCGWPDCDRPPSFTEAHHIDQWKRDNGNTDVIDGILLCRFHHMLLHNNDWRIVRDDSGQYLLIPPKDRDPGQKPISMPSRSPALRDLQRLTAGRPPELLEQPPESLKQRSERPGQRPEPPGQLPKPVERLPKPLEQPPEPPVQPPDPPAQPPDPPVQPPGPLEQPPNPLKRRPEPLQQLPKAIEQPPGPLG